jgi:tRNA(fMet)-specific endonuclease VapC
MTGITHPNFLLDTVAAIARLNKDKAIIALLTSDISVKFPIIVLGELYAGAEKSGRVQENIKKVDEFVNNRDIVFCDQDTARIYAKISAQLRAKGRPIPQNDLWIAALAMQHGFMLVTRDKHFDEVDGILLKAW